MVTDITLNIIYICFCIILVTYIIFSLIVYKYKEDLFFIRKHRSIVTIQGLFNKYLALGLPKNKYGALIYFLFLLICALEIFIVLFIYNFFD